MRPVAARLAGGDYEDATAGKPDCYKKAAIAFRIKPNPNYMKSLTL